MSETIKIEIEIPAPPEGWGEVAFRKVEHGEYSTMIWSGSVWQKCIGQTANAYLVARKLAPPWTPPPEWHAMFGDCWLTRDRHNNFRVHQAKPESFAEHGIWECHGTECYISVFRSELFPPYPTTIPWEQCCFKIGEPRE